jgi:hypothetical protein
MYISSTVTYLVVFTVLNFIKLDSLTELFIGGILVVILFFLLILLFKVVDKSDFDTISILTKGLGPLTPIIHKILDLILPYISG